MHLALPGGGKFSDLQLDVQRLESAERDRRRKEFLSALRDATPALLDAAEAIESSWRDLPLSTKQTMVEVKRSFDEQARAPRPELHPLERFKRGAMALSLLVNQSEIRNYTFAMARFVCAVSWALADEARHRRTFEEAERNDRNAQTIIAQGQKEYKANLGERFTASEFVNRFTFK